MVFLGAMAGGVGISRVTVLVTVVVEPGGGLYIVFIFLSIVPMVFVIAYSPYIPYNSYLLI